MVISRPLSVEEICEKLRPLFGKKIDELYFRYSVAQSLDERDEIEHLLRALYQKHLNRLLYKGVILEPPNKEDVSGEYPLAMVKYAGKKLFPFCLREKDWQRHVCVTGMSGSGKTTFAIKIIRELSKHRKPFLVFDWKKSFRPLVLENPDLMIFTIGNENVTNLFRTNINEPPPGVSPKEWISALVDLITESFSVSFGVHKILIETIDEAFKEWGVYQGSNNYPTWNHIKWLLDEKLEKARGREEGWVESAARIAMVLTFGEFGNVINYKAKNRIRVEDLLNKKVIFELNSLGNVEKKFFCEFVLMYIYRMKKADPESTEKGFEHAIVVDEAHNIFLKQQTHFSNESVTDMMYREMREYGTSLICLDQHISKLSDTVKGNSACHVAFQQQLPQDIEDISSLMQLREKKHFFSSLSVGEAIVKLSERHTSPFLVETEDIALRKESISDNDIKKRMQALIGGYEVEKNIDPEFNKKLVAKEEKKELKEEPKSVQDVLYNVALKWLKKGESLEEIERKLEENKKGYTSQDVMNVINKLFYAQLSMPQTEESVKKNFDLDEDEQKFIDYLIKHKNDKLSTVEIYKALGFSARKGTKTKDSLQKKGLIKIEEFKYDKGRKKIIVLSEDVFRD